MTLIESLACGLPIIASGIGAMRSMVDNYRYGLLFDMVNKTDLRSKVTWVMSHPDELAEMARLARREYLTRYRGKQSYLQLMEIYRSTLAGELN